MVAGLAVNAPDQLDDALGEDEGAPTVNTAGKWWQTNYGDQRDRN